MLVCENCGRENSADARFCSGCGSPLAPAVAAREERKVVTVLFCDLVGFTARAERLDPEEVRALQAPYWTHVRSDLERFGGTVEKFIGDAVMALFGAPTAHEDDPERAVRAALAIRDWAREEGGVQVRIGITTGEALVALGARPEHGEGMASGDVVNTAARLQAAAPENGIVVDETTYRATERVIEYRPAQPVAAKGKGEPVTTWEAVEARARFGVDVRLSVRAELVGREDELALLVAALNRARREREPQLVTLVGVPGIGKSRLVFELFQTVEREPDLVYWRQGRSLPYGEGVSFWALAEMVKAQAGILETDSAEEATGKLRRTVVDLVGDDDGDWVEGHLRPLVGLSADGETTGDRRDEAFAAWRRFLEGLAEQRPLVLVFEDLHWADEGLLDFVDHLVDWAGGVPMLVVGTARPELLARRPDWGGGKPHATTVSLSALSDHDMARLVHELLGQPVLPADLQAGVLARAGGNPLYAEEFARIAAERGLGDGEPDLPLPESVQGIVAARLDALQPHEKELLQNAAVIGKVFWLGALAEMSGSDRRRVEADLHALDRKEFVRRERRSSVAGEVEFAFRHLLVRDVAYGQIPRAERAERHRRAAAWIEALSSERSEDRAEMLAHHYSNALQYVRAAGADTSPFEAAARAAFRDAGDRAFALNSFGAAARFYEQALSLWPADDPGRAQVLFRHAQALYSAGDPARHDRLAEAREALLGAGDSESGALADTLLSEYWWYQGQRDRSSEYLERALAAVRGLEPSAATVRVMCQAARDRMLAGRHEEAIRVGNEALAAAEALGLPALQAHALGSIGGARARSGDWADGIADLERAVDVALEANSSDAARTLTNLSAIVSGSGDHRRALVHYEEARRVGERFGNVEVLRFLRGQVVGHKAMSGEWDEALHLADAFIAECESGSPHYLESAVRTARARLWFARGDTESALTELQKALELAREVRDPQRLFMQLGVSARIHDELGRADEARSFAGELLDLARAHHTSFGIPELAWVADSLAIAPDVSELLAAAGPGSRWFDVAGLVVAGDFARAADLYYEIGILPEEALARLRAAERLVTEGRRAEADVQLEKSLAFWRSVGATRYIRQGERLLAATA